MRVGEIRREERAQWGKCFEDVCVLARASAIPLRSETWAA